MHMTAGPTGFYQLTEKEPKMATRSQAAPPSFTVQLAGASPEQRSRPPFKNLRAWGERGERWDSILVTPGMGEGVEGGRLRVAIVAVPEARGEICSSREREGHGLGHV